MAARYEHKAEIAAANGLLSCITFDLLMEILRNTCQYDSVSYHEVKDRLAIVRT